MSTYRSLIDQAKDWLLDAAEPGPRYLAMRDIYPEQHTDYELRQASLEAHLHGPIWRVLEHMSPEGWWAKAGPGYSPKYRSTVWAVTQLAQLGASVKVDARLDTACAYLLANAWSEGGYFSHDGRPSGTFDCLQGNLTWALLALGFKDQRLDQSMEWLARSQTGEGVAPRIEKDAPLRYYRYKCGPGFRCAANGEQSCAWGAAKAMMAFSLVPPEERTELVQRAIDLGVEYFLSIDPATASWPSQEKISRNWWKFGFPVFYITDLLQVAEALTALGYANDPRMAGLIELIAKKQVIPGRWALEYNYDSKTWGTYGKTGQPNKWVTIRALRVLRRVA